MLEVRKSRGGVTNGCILHSIVLTSEMEPHCCCGCREVSGTNWILPAMENPVVLLGLQDMMVFADIVVR